MAEAAGSTAAGRAPPDAAHRAEEEPEPASLDAPAAAAGRRRERRSGVSAVGAAERFPGGSLGTAAAPDPDACLLEAAKATPRRSSIIKVRAGSFRGSGRRGSPGAQPPSGRRGSLGRAGERPAVGRLGGGGGGWQGNGPGWAAVRWEPAGEGLRAPSARLRLPLRSPPATEEGRRGCGAASPERPPPPGEGASPDRAACWRGVSSGAPVRPVPGERAAEGGGLWWGAVRGGRGPARARACPVDFAAGQLPGEL